jgi:ubiquinone/menaquinone biosynthesis C-methylase UbiE
MSENLPGFFEGTGMPDAGWWEALWPNPAGVLAKVGMRSGMDVVDLCSGDGWFTLQIAKIAKSVVSIDIDGKLLATAKARLEESGVTNCTFIEGSAYDLAKAVHDHADHVFLANAFHGVPDRPRLARAVRSILRPGGLFAIVSWHARPREETPVLGEPRGPATEQRMTPDSTIKPVRQAGMSLAELVEIPPYHYGAVFRR